MPKRFFDDEFKAKKVWVDFQRHQNSSTGYKLKSQISKNKQKTSVKHTLNSEVVIKITGASKDFGNLKISQQDKAYIKSFQMRLWRVCHVLRRVELLSNGIPYSFNTSF